MIFQVKRTSQILHDKESKPHDKAYWGKIDKSEFMSINDFEGWLLNIFDLDALTDLAEEQDIIVLTRSGEPDMIEIYDDYRE